MTAVLLGLEPTSSRRIYLADSFKGLPKDSDVSSWKPQNKINGVLGGTVVSSRHGKEGMFRATRKKFEENMKANNFDVSKLQHRITVLEGFYADTLPKLKERKVKLSFLRLDGDIYISTIQALENAYELVQPGGYIYVDDYGSWEGCRRAVDFFRQSVGDNEPLFPIFENDTDTTFFAVWWRKPKLSIEHNQLQTIDEIRFNFLHVIYLFASLIVLLLFVKMYQKRNKLQIVL